MIPIGVYHIMTLDIAFYCVVEQIEAECKSGTSFTNSVSTQQHYIHTIPYTIP